MSIRRVSGKFASNNPNKKTRIVNALKNTSDLRFQTLSQIADHFGVSKSRVIEINKEFNARNAKLFASVRLVKSPKVRDRNIKRFSVAVEYVKRYGLKNKNGEVIGVSVNHLIEYLKSKKISPGTKKNIGFLLNEAIKKVESETGNIVVRRTKSDQPKRK